MSIYIYIINLKVCICLPFANLYPFSNLVFTFLCVTPCPEMVTWGKYILLISNARALRSKAWSTFIYKVYVCKLHQLKQQIHTKFKIHVARNGNKPIHLSQQFIFIEKRNVYCDYDYYQMILLLTLVSIIIFLLYMPPFYKSHSSHGTVH